MSKKFIKNQGLYIGSNRNKYIGYMFIFLLVLLFSYLSVKYFYTSIINNSKDVHRINIELNSKVQELKKKIYQQNSEILKLEKTNGEMSSIFSKYTDAIKFEVATAEEVKSNLFKKDEIILSLNREINYYKYLLHSKNKTELISIENFKFNIIDSDNLEYDFLLLSNKSDVKIYGKYHFYVDGIDANNKIIKRKELYLSNKKSKKIKFKNYMRINGKIKIPKINKISVLYLNVLSDGKKYSYKQTIN